jgi:hypothetical protein
MVGAEAGVHPSGPRGRVGLLNMPYSLRNSRIVYALAQLGSSTQRRVAQTSLLEVSDLPGEGWQLLGAMTWRTGRFGKPSDVWRRARKAGTFTSARSLSQPTVPRWLLIKVAPTASVEDATEVVPQLLSLSTPNPKARVTVTSEGPVGDVSVAILADPWVYEQSTTGMPEGPTSSRYVAGHVANVAILIACSGNRDAWVWDDVVELAAKQALTPILHGTP